MEPRSTSLVPLGPEGQPLDPLTFLIYLFFLPIRIIIEFVNNTAPAIQRVVRAPFPSLVPREQPLATMNVIEAPSYTVHDTKPEQPAPATYENEERCEIVWNEDGLPVEIIIHRRAIRT